MDTQVFNVQTKPNPSAQQSCGHLLLAPSIRRKPIITYRSPSGGESSSSSPNNPLKLSSIPSPSPNPKPDMDTAVSSIHEGVIRATLKRKKHAMAPPLPLYHPLGRLALSLPPLDPSAFGLPTPITADDGTRRSSARARRPAAKIRDAEEEATIPVPTVSAIAAIAAREVKEKASPRKRRSGGGSSGSKRKRKEVEDGDATYPAKRTRIPRGVNQTADSGSPPSSTNPAPEITPTPESTVEPPDEKKPERRSTRSRGANKRRDSSASETPSVSASVGATVSSNGTSKTKDPDNSETEKKSEPEQHQSNNPTQEKEDGELAKRANLIHKTAIICPHTLPTHWSHILNQMLFFTCLTLHFWYSSAPSSHALCVYFCFMVPRTFCNPKCIEISRHHRI
ncbi:hypothetical protein BD779DRAFT_140085 [Infundibulicybe gibba]|nr:hypothetical protein BD779DRAFT_140085 [Infundibulicybe gibba]